MDGIRRGLAMAAAHAVCAALARAGNGSSDISVRRQANLAPVAVRVRRLRTRRHEATCSLADHTEVSEA